MAGVYAAPQEKISLPFLIVNENEPVRYKRVSDRTGMTSRTVHKFDNPANTGAYKK
jgi:hypothetical protein